MFLYDIKYILLWLNLSLSYYAYNNNFYYKNKVDRVYYSLIWILLKLYSKMEIIYKNLKKTDLKNITIKLINNGDIVKNYDNEFLNKYNDEQEFIIKNTEVMLNKYMIIGEYNDGENIKIVRFNNFNDIKLNSEYYKESSVKLIGIQLKIIDCNNNEKEVLPLLLYKNCNYFIENNILFDRKFINYYLKTEKKKILEIDDNYEIDFFDNDINSHKITGPQYVKINKENFEIIENNETFEIINNNFEYKCQDNDVKDDKNVHKYNIILGIKDYLTQINWVGPIYADQCDEDY